MTQPLVSIIIPCFRHAQLLPQAVDSALAQTHRCVEVVVVNDGSDDETGDVAARYGRRIRYVEKDNGGLASARNSGLRASTGRYVHFLDADDLIHADAIVWLVDALDGRDNRVAIMGWRPFANRPDDLDEPAHLPPPEAPLFEALFRHRNPVHVFLTPRKLIEAQGGFHEPLRSHEDWDLWLRIAYAGAGLATQRKVGAYYRQGPGSMSGNRDTMVASAAEVLLRFCRLVEEDPSFLGRWGADLLRTVYAVRRRFRARGMHSVLAAGLTSVVRELRRRGVRVREPWLVRIQDVLPPALGDVVERVGLEYFRVFRPRLYSAIRD